MLEILATLLSFLASTADVEQLRATAPKYLTTETAREHLGRARAADMMTGEDASVLLAIGWHESNYIQGYVQPEPGNRVSCGVMTPYPIKGPCPTRTLAEEYLDGARHLAEWRHLVPGAPILGYAGLAGACSQGPYIKRGINLCGFEGEMLERAAWIRARSKGDM